MVSFRSIRELLLCGVLASDDLVTIFAITVSISSLIIKVGGISVVKALGGFGSGLGWPLGAVLFFAKGFSFAATAFSARAAVCAARRPSNGFKAPTNKSFPLLALASREKCGQHGASPGESGNRRRMGCQELALLSRVFCLSQLAPFASEVPQRLFMT